MFGYTGHTYRPPLPPGRLTSTEKMLAFDSRITYIHECPDCRAIYESKRQEEKPCEQCLAIGSEDV